MAYFWGIRVVNPKDAIASKETKMKNILPFYLGFLAGCLLCDLILKKTIADIEDNYPKK